MEDLYYLSILPLAILGISAPHGRFYSLGRHYPDREDEWPASVAHWILNSLKIKYVRKSFLFDWIALTVTGLCFSAPLSMISSSISIFSSSIILLSGFLKPLCYEISIRVNRYDHVPLAEVLTGLVFGLSFLTMLR